MRDAGLGRGGGDMLRGEKSGHPVKMSSIIHQEKVQTRFGSVCMCISDTGTFGKHHVTKLPSFGETAR